MFIEFTINIDDDLHIINESVAIVLEVLLMKWAVAQNIEDCKLKRIPKTNRRSKKLRFVLPDPHFYTVFGLTWDDFVKTNSKSMVPIEKLSWQIIQR